MMTLHNTTTFAVQIVIQDDTGFVKHVASVTTDLLQTIADLSEALDFAATVLGIGLRSLAWGVMGL